MKQKTLKQKTLLIASLLLFCSPAWSQQNIDNPVLPRVADAGVMKYNGRYYIGGVHTYGDFYVSTDLVHWGEPVHVVTMNNDWATPFGIGNEQIHANDIHYINGTFHLYWSVNHWSRERNVVHIVHAVSVHPLGPYTEPEKERWLDNRIDPHLFIDDDGRMYLYMVKFTDGNTIWARPMRDPATFDGEPKYIFASQPGNWETLDNRVEEGPWVIKYRNRYYLMYNTNHTAPEYGNYMLGVAEASAPLDFNHGNKYAWPVVTSNQIDLEETYVDLLNRQDDGNFRFVYDKTKHGNLSLRIHHTGAAKAYLNGSLVYSAEKRDYRHIDLSKNRNLSINGSNTLTIEGQLGKHGVALFALKEQIADDILFTPGQPNILRGPNGFEWWLIYMANKNAEPRGQYINRVHFFGKKLVVDGITGKHTPGEHPAPSKPTWQYLSDNNQQQPQINQPIPSTPATNYYFETGIKSAATNASNDGIIAWKADDDNWLKILIDAANKQWSYIISQKGTQETFSFPLSADFKANVFHTVSLFKNHTDFTVRIDDLPAPAKPVIEIPFAGKGLPGICSGNANAAFDGITYTIGWDEYDEHIKGWQPSKDLPGLQLKGDLLDNYELSVQINADAEKGIAAVYPVYINPDNYLKATFDFTGEQFSISGKTKGKEMPAQKISLAHLQKHYANSTFSDFAERHFIFDSPTTLNAILFKKEVPENVHIHYVKNGHWQELSSIKHAEWEHPGFRRIEFAPIETTELIFVPKTTENLSALQEIRINERFKQSYNLRVVKNQKDVRIFVDGKQVCELPNKSGNSQVGLFSEQGKAIFSAITLFQIVE